MDEWITDKMAAARFHMSVRRLRALETRAGVGRRMLFNAEDLQRIYDSLPGVGPPPLPGRPTSGPDAGPAVRRREREALAEYNRVREFIRAAKRKPRTPCSRRLRPA